MSLWLNRHVHEGDTLRFHGPHGDCNFSENKILPENDLYLIGAGTGIYPLYGIAKEAIYRGFLGRIIFVQVALNESRVYFVDQLKHLQNQYSNFFYHRVFNTGTSLNEFEHVGNLEDCLEKVIPDFRSGFFFLCGDPQIVTRVKKFLFLNEVSLKNIRSDAFVMQQY